MAWFVLPAGSTTQWHVFHLTSNFSLHSFGCGLRSFLQDGHYSLPLLQPSVKLLGQGDYSSGAVDGVVTHGVILRRRRYPCPAEIGCY
jgi:hypothetical protein